MHYLLQFLYALLAHRPQPVYKTVVRQKNYRDWYMNYLNIEFIITISSQSNTLMSTEYNCLHNRLKIDLVSSDSSAT